MQAAIALVEWFKREADRVYTMLAESDEDRLLLRLVRWLRGRAGQTCTAREAARHVHAFRSNYTAAETCLRTLVQRGLARREVVTHGPGGGRPAETFTLQ